MPTVLIAEDEPTVLMLAESILEDAGFVVMTASDGNQAIAILNGSHSFDVVVTDINMGDGPDGHAVAAAATRLKQRPKVVYTSALPLTDGLQALLVEGSVYVGKPYDGSGLIAAVKKALQS